MCFLCGNDNYEPSSVKRFRIFMRNLLMVWLLTCLLSLIILWIYTTSYTSIEIEDEQIHQQTLRSRSLSSCALRSLDEHMNPKSPFEFEIMRFNCDGSNTKRQQKGLFEPGPVYQLM